MVISVEKPSHFTVTIKDDIEQYPSRIRAGKFGAELSLLARGNIALKDFVLDPKLSNLCWTFGSFSMPPPSLYLSFSIRSRVD